MAGDERSFVRQTLLTRPSFFDQPVAWQCGSRWPEWLARSLCLGGEEILVAVTFPRSHLFPSLDTSIGG